MKVILVGAISALVLVLFEIFYVPLPSDKKITDVLIIRRGDHVDSAIIDNRLLEVSSPHEGYRYLQDVVTLYEEVGQLKPDKVSLDVLEIAFWWWYLERHFEHWQSNYVGFFGIVSRGGMSKVVQDEAEKDIKTMPPTEISQYLSDNPYRNTLNNMREIPLPLGTSFLSIKRNNDERTFQLRNKYLTFTIKMYRVYSSSVQMPYLGIDFAEGGTSTYGDCFKVEMECSYEKLYRGAPQMSKQKKWANDVMDGFYNAFDWSLIKNDLEKACLLNMAK
ncbi:MAG: hypothetical protein WCT39_00730 [Candidatus Margulisiibacteriota bacterium]